MAHTTTQAETVVMSVFSLTVSTSQTQCHTLAVIHSHNINMTDGHGSDRTNRAQ